MSGKKDQGKKMGKGVGIRELRERKAKETAEARGRSVCQSNRYLAYSNITGSLAPAKDN